MDKVGVLPGAREAAVVEVNIAFLENSELPLLLILFDWIERLFGSNFKLFSDITIQKVSRMLQEVGKGGDGAAGGVSESRDNLLRVGIIRSA